MKVYLAARFQNKLMLINHTVPVFIEAGHTITSRWLDGDGPSKKDTALMDVEDVEAADAIVFFLDQVLDGERPAQGAWFELGYAYAKGKKCLVIGAHLSASVFLELPGVISCSSWAEAISSL